ncbi:hypothetical protein SOV_32310 [Sporomusa ovata DSM 2662]|uniref:Uncharacterized protein n=1 Tax=Sporomusa ovata TaxID=2378 RepID=A0A0U1L4E0_9FIRM|nr:hypothetical protein [Sporomusa ovata]EQB25186.1 hypothetical protein SOV_5c03360 [Sporomusa ovata DSM 2662]CQR73744.1 hypothetical protein SpAn4DRAFT_0206 [Sporomusa ovata]
MGKKLIRSAIEESCKEMNYQIRCIVSGEFGDPVASVYIKNTEYYVKLDLLKAATVATRKIKQYYEKKARPPPKKSLTVFIPGGESGS